MRALLAQIAKHKLRTYEGVTQQFVHSVSGMLKDAAANVDAQHKYRESKLQAQSPDHRLDPNGAAIRGENKRQRQHGQQAKNAGESPHLFSSNSI
jgi:hypothetical protein